MNLRYMFLGAILGGFATASAITLFAIPYILYGECSLRWTEACTTEEKLQHIEALKRLVIANS